MKRHATLLACLLPLLAAPPRTQEAATATTSVTVKVEAKAGTFKLPAGEISLTDLIDRAAAFLDCNILVAAAEIAGAAPVRLQKAIETDRDGCLDLLSNLLYRNGLALTVLDEQLDIYEVILMTGQRGREIMMRAQWCAPEEALAAPRRKLPVTVAVPLQHINATIATNALRPFFASSGNNMAGLTLGNVGDSASMLLSGMQDQVAQAIQLLRACDVATGDSQANDPLFQRIQLLEARVAELERRLAAAAGKER
ncbi:MAG: hypothetical protein H6835_08705 [Planctomycetes bacterium]|nr:hypothetical protein [Planctomycetota bacterium]